MIRRHKVPAWIPEDWDIEGFQGIDDILSEPGFWRGQEGGVGVCRVVDPCVDATAHVFEEAGVDCSVDLITRFGGEDSDCRVVGRHPGEFVDFGDSVFLGSLRVLLGSVESEYL